MKIFLHNMHIYRNYLTHSPPEVLTHSTKESFTMVAQDMYGVTQALDTVFCKLAEHNIQYQEEKIFLNNIQLTRKTIDNILKNTPLCT